MARDVIGEWLAGLADLKARARIAVRIDRLVGGNFGDSKSLGEGLHELRVDWEPGYRVYYGKTETAYVLLLCGGDKRKQFADIKKAGRIGRTTRKGRRRNETQTQHFSW
jgi:putative addiction module killer protein